MSMTTPTQAVRLPAEWEPQSGVQLTWPTLEADWKNRLDLVEYSLAQIAYRISEREKVLIVCENPDRVTGILKENGANLDAVRLYPIFANDVWARDHGPITVLEGGRPVLLDFGFNGWGLKYPSNFDNQLTRMLRDRNAWGTASVRTMPMVLEGGSIESDGLGTLLTTSNCLLSPNRNPAWGKAEVEQRLTEWLGFQRFLWLDHGAIPGDDTDAHIDTLARLCDPQTIAYVGQEDNDPELRASLAAMEEQLQTFRTAEGAPYHLIKLPPPAEVFDEDGLRLPATYANFLIINGAVLVPAYHAPDDAAAVEVLKPVFPDRDVISVDCLGPVLQYGSLHCVTMQLPAGVLS